MKRDSIYYKIFQRFPELLFELVDEPPEQAPNYRFESVEVKETAFRIDGVFLPPEGVTPRIIFFAEVQFQKDESLYHRFFTESMMYLNQNQGQYDDWYCVVIFPSRSLEPKDKKTHRIFLDSDQVQRIYLKELGAPERQPIGINLIQLTIASKKAMSRSAKQLIERVQLEETDTEAKNKIIDIITTIAVYKFSSLSREDVEAMLGLNIEETRIYQDLERQTKLKAATRLINMGYSISDVAQAVDLSVEEVATLASNPPSA
ncbi:hypothetical protein CAL7716_106470 (plasmid) [Calothrix sp. PCC 7716]|nr:hypothetical protein CAL7716_106470 [Calothrix sp. PCC 7716]